MIPARHRNGFGPNWHGCARNCRARSIRIQAADSGHTERKRAEGELLQRAQLSALGAAVGLALTDTGSLAGALQQCAEALVTHVGAAFARIWTLNEREACSNCRRAPASTRI